MNVTQNSPFKNIMIWTGIAFTTIIAPHTHATSANTLYMCNFTGSSILYQINASTGAKLPIGSMGIQCTDIAFRAHELYAVTFSQLWKINPNTGKPSFIGDMNVVEMDINGLTVNPLTGKMYAAGSSSGNFYQVNPSTGHTTRIGNFGPEFTSAGDMTFLNNVLYATVRRTGFNNTWLVRINLLNGAATLIGDLGFNDVWGLSVYSGTTLYATTAEGHVLKVNKNTGKAILVGKNNVVSGGLTTSPNW